MQPSAETCGMFLRLVLAACFAGSGALTAGASSFHLKTPSPSPGFNPAAPVVDVNLGESPEDFVVACWSQLTGSPPDADETRTWASKLGTPEAPRRIDLALMLADRSGVQPRFEYSDPWEEQAVLDDAPLRDGERRIGAVMMFFFHCPDDPNGSIHWCNNHAPGMDRTAEIYGFGNMDRGYYNPENPGFWYRELKDAAHAGLGFFLLNCYGPDWKPSMTEPLRRALETIDAEDGAARVKLALFDDTWSWGKTHFGEFWKQTPDLSRTAETAKLLYEAKWKKFFTDIPRDWWFTVGDRPLVYFYNAGTLHPRKEAAAVIGAMKKLFEADFGVEPFVAVDTAYFEDPRMPEAADARFRWMTLDLPGGFSLGTKDGTTLAHAMVRWDSTGRDNGNRERMATSEDRLIKDDARLVSVLDATRDADLLVLATWNDLGEGTGINRCHDYYWDGRWRAPDHFMRLIRRSQEEEILGKDRREKPAGHAP